MTTILFRCDASLLIGSGHVIRCRTLARELTRCGAVITFLCRRQPGDQIDLLEREFQVLCLPEQSLPACEGLEGRELYGAWLGCSQDTDAAHCLHALAQAGITKASWLVVDHYGLDHRWEMQILDGLAGYPPPRLLVIDDLADRPHQADLLLDQNFFGDANLHRYADLVPDHCHLLLGPKFALLGSEYAKLHPFVPPRTELRRVLVFFGGADSNNLTSQVLRTLMEPPLDNLAVDVVLGRFSPHANVVTKLASCRPDTTCHEPLDSLAGLITRSDMAIGAGGGYTFERLALNTPSIAVSIATNQQLPLLELEKLGCLSMCKTPDISKAIQHHCADFSIITSNLSLGKEKLVCDGRGAERIRRILQNS